MLAALIVGVLHWRSRCTGVSKLVTGRYGWQCAIIFYLVWALLYSTFFTNPVDGLASGMWQSLGYWIVQQGRGQGETNPGTTTWSITPGLRVPATSCSPFLPTVYYVRTKATPSVVFLVYWATTTFVLRTPIASEKMPWLLVEHNPAADRPLQSDSSGDLIERIRLGWTGAVSPGEACIVALGGVPLLHRSLLWSACPLRDGSGWKRHFGHRHFCCWPLGGAARRLHRIRRSGRSAGWATAGSPRMAADARSLLILLGPQPPCGLRSPAYENADTPVELLVYTQTTPEIVELFRDRIEEALSDVHRPRACDPVDITSRRRPAASPGPGRGT